MWDVLFGLHEAHVRAVEPRNVLIHLQELHHANPESVRLQTESSTCIIQTVLAGNVSLSELTRTIVQLWNPKGLLRFYDSAC
jgi:hypothetical protein